MRGQKSGMSCNRVDCKVLIVNQALLFQHDCWTTLLTPEAPLVLIKIDAGL